MSEHHPVHDRDRTDDPATEPARPPVEEQSPEDPSVTSYDRQQRDVGMALLIGGVTVILLLAAIVYYGLS